MTALALVSPASLFDSGESLKSDLAGLIHGYLVDRGTIERVAEAMADPSTATVLPYFVDGNNLSDSLPSESVARRLFELDGAVAALDANYWQRAFELTDVWEAMPQARRDEWRKQIDARECLPFEPDAVVSTLQGLLAMRYQFFGEKVDGCFRALSGEHVTNRPQGFSKRMIFAGILCLTCGNQDWWTADYRRVGHLLDLRAVLARFMGREAPGYASTEAVIKHARHNVGEWLDCDGGAFRIRVYKKGTAHVEVHPDLAWRLNEVLASLHPRAVASEFRQPPKRRPSRKLFSHVLSSSIVDALASLKPSRATARNVGEVAGWEVFTDRLDKPLRRAVEDVLSELGGVPCPLGRSFDFDPSDVLADVVVLGVMPDRRAYQFYPTPREIVDLVIEAADLREGLTCLEPSAGFGALARRLPVESTTCVEISLLHSRALEREGYLVVCGDFLATAGGLGSFDRVVMNPPFAGGQARAHVEAAAELVADGGRLVAVLPASLADNLTLPGFGLTWSEPIHGAFAGASVSVVVLTAAR